MMSVFATGRKAQNYYHYLSMTNSAYFDMLTTNTQVFIIMIILIMIIITILIIDISEETYASKDFDLLFSKRCALVFRAQCYHCHGPGSYLHHHIVTTICVK